ncbi:MAG: 4Fe-4S binding protein [Desulfotalea sp.]
MKKSYVTYMLCQNEIGNTQLVGTEINLLPGQGFTSDQDETVLLAGGFTSIAPETSFLLSPTLQLNADLAGYGSSQLEILAAAELRRGDDKLYRSYTVDPDSRLCVVASSVENLKNFIDTYGGLLPIEPILIGSFDPEFTTAKEMSISSPVNGVLIDYVIAKPVDKSKCNYCGICGAICPESCISPGLDVDFSTCSLCRECEKVCPTKAIEIHGVEHRTLKIPAILILDECKIEGVDSCRAVYTEENFDEFLKGLYPFQVDEIISVNKDLCQYNQKLNLGCNLCFESCRHGAISLNDGVGINPLVCEECGDCVAVCPTGALQYERFTDSSSTKYFQTIEPLLRDKVVIGSDEDMHKFWWLNSDQSYENCFFFATEKPEFLTLTTLLFMYAKGSRDIVIVKSDDEGHILNRNVKLANTILQAIFSVASPITLVSKLSAEDLEVKNEGDSLPKFSGQEFINRRELQSDVLSHLLAESEATPGFKGNAQTSFATIDCDNDKCTQCMSCINVCKIKAMKADDDEMSISHKSSLCVACGLCVSVCPEDALTISRNWQFKNDFFQEKTMAMGEPMACVKCGKVFGTRKSYERVMNILKAKESVDTSHFEYCDECRVVRIFEEQ